MKLEKAKEIIVKYFEDSIDIEIKILGKDHPIEWVCFGEPLTMRDVEQAFYVLLNETDLGDYL